MSGHIPSYCMVVQFNSHGYELSRSQPNVDPDSRIQDIIDAEHDAKSLSLTLVYHMSIPPITAWSIHSYPPLSGSRSDESPTDTTCTSI